MKVYGRNLEKFELELTIPQSKQLQSILPTGYVLALQRQASDEDSTQTTPKKQNKSAKTEPLQEPASGRVLRDKNKKKSHIETMYSDYDSSGLPGKPLKGTQDGKKKCLAIIQKLKRHKHSQPFLLPLDKNKLSGPSKQVREHMDLTTVENNLKSGLYISTLEFAGDVRKIWNNALIFADEKSPTFQKAKEMSAYFESLFEDVENEKISNNYHDLQLQVERLSKELIGLNSKKATPQTPARKQIKSQKSSESSTKNAPLSLQEKRKLGQMIQSLPAQYLRGVCQIVTDGLPNLNDNADVLEFDIDTLAPVKVRELQKYVTSKLKLLKREQNKARSHSNSTTSNKMKKEPLENKNQSQDQDIIASNSKAANNIAEKSEQVGSVIAASQNNAKEEVSEGSDSSFITDSDDSTYDKGQNKKKIKGR